MTRTVLCPVDGRYKNKVLSVHENFSEFALLKSKVQIEIGYVVEFCKVIGKPLKKEDLDRLLNLYENFDLSHASSIEAIETKTMHDIKAIEIFIRSYISSDEHKEYVHFGLTSQDVNSLALSSKISNYYHTYRNDQLEKFISVLEKLSYRTETIVIPARTHGQVAVPTKLGKEIYVYVYRLKEILKNSGHINNLSAKFGGAIGNLNAHYYAYPSVDWQEFCDNYVSSWGLNRSKHTTQVDNNDALAALLDHFKQINNVLLDFTRDMWLYYSYGYFNKLVSHEEVGSSTMPQKSNPIEFENAEGNIELANNLFQFISNKIQVSRLQRDLTDSTVLRNIGLPFAYTNLAISSLISGIEKSSVNTEAAIKDVEAHPELLAEGLQILLRKEKVVNAYEVIKKYVRENKINKESLETILEEVNLKQSIKEKISSFQVKNYLGRFIRS